MTAPRVRPARPGDAAFAAPLLQEAIGAVGHVLTGTDNDLGSAAVLGEFFGQPGNRVSFVHTLIAQGAAGPLGLAVAYPGAEAAALDGPLRARLRARGLAADFPGEGTPGELYLDTLAVSAAARGQGVGGLLLDACARRARTLGLARMGLLVERDNPAARLYARHGFAPVGTRELAGGEYLHLVRELNGDAVRT